ncbi:MAG: ribosome biogenesis GTPase Der [Candidatus Buchananbacteria bacterium RBG_13_36_9]|uniref:GTPase Der n=1 Tax=Candidatus Buchananbacteria bacterium RBG_13_36_9 TaxID=1797530 RepID=A0A1G1XSN0_9BACT|nr:MAG: ribosome biogenesis GTPase Der [Candidatus Buchananbacteria bacterium RBG_13_36_9]
MKNLPKVIIIGRANVGKSTLFNRLLEKPKAITSAIAGTTRDFLLGQIYWQGINFELIDTGGVQSIISSKKIKKLTPSHNIEYSLDIIKKTQAALQEADLILLLVDIQAGLLPQDRELAKAVKKFNKEIILAANKTDVKRLENQGYEFLKLGLGLPIYVSGLNGAGTGDLLDVIVTKLKKIKKVRKAKKLEIKKAIKISIIGKPNVGKSSLLNAILGEDRVIVSPIPFTTREAIDTNFQYTNQNITLIDTAGIRKQAHIAPGLEKMSVRKSITNAKQSDLCLLVLDISNPITVQDNKLSKILLDARVGIIIIANKWDLIPEKDLKTHAKFTNYIYRNFPYLTWAPVIFVSALTHQNIHRVLDQAMQIYQAKQTKISDSALSKFLKQALKKHKPQVNQNNVRPYLSNLKQVRTNPPSFTLQIRKKDSLTQAYIKYLENSLRQKFKLIGTPINISIKKGEKS